MSQWIDFVKAVARSRVECPELKTVQLAQAMLESGRGTSALFTSYRNPYGMKYRKEMASVATSVSYTDHANETDSYCDFADFDKAAEAYWLFIDRSVYKDWRDHAASPEAFIKYIAYAGYIGGPHDGTPASTAQKDAYIAKVTGLFAEAKKLLKTHEPVAPPAIADAAVCTASFYLGQAHLHAELSKNGSSLLEEAAKALDKAADVNVLPYVEQIRALANPWYGDDVLIDDVERALETVESGKSNYENTACIGYFMGHIYGHCILGAEELEKVDLLDTVTLSTERAVLMAGEGRCNWDECMIRHEFDKISERIERYGVKKLNLLKPSIDVLMKNFWSSLQ